MNIWRHPQLPMKDLCNRVGIEKGSFSTVADHLIKLGYIQVIKDPTDRRKNLLQLTQSGENKAIYIERAFEKYLATKLTKLTSNEEIKLEEILNYIRTINLKLREGASFNGKR